MILTLQQFKYAVVIADKGNISKAAQELFIAQPSLTNSMKELENELGFTVFERTNKGVIVSLEGRDFLGYARLRFDPGPAECFLSQSRS